MVSSDSGIYNWIIFSLGNRHKKISYYISVIYQIGMPSVPISGTESTELADQIIGDTASFLSSLR